MIRSRKKLFTTLAVTTVIMLIGALWNLHEIRQKVVDAAVQQNETVNIRIIGTTDLHGQLNTTDYEQGIKMHTGGLAKVFSLIEQTRKELPRENTFTLDAGDVLFDYTTEYIFSENQNEIQPIYKAMALVGYDAITLGNHEFDYGYEYILRQLNGSGMRNVTVVSNVVDSKTGEYPFLENMLLTRKMKTNSGKVVEIKVGIIGQTIPNLTAKTHSYAGILKTEDMVINAQKQAKKLKDMGANVIIALSHTGIGPEEPELNFKNVAYALTKIPEIDVVVAGHEHNLFPTTDMTSPYYKLPNVDRNTYLMNGKNVIMAGDRGSAIGVVDLSLQVNGKNVSIANRKSELRFTNASIKENETIAALFKDWEKKLLQYTTDVIGELENNVIIHNFYGLLGDNTAIQLLNDAKMNYAMRYINTTGRQYKNYPVIAASRYTSYGLDSIDDYINIKNKITESNLKQIQYYNSYLHLYRINGKQLREWLEWSASAYETINVNTTWTDAAMQNVMKERGLKSLISEPWLNDWSNFFIFDGVHYEIDPSVLPRYDFSGNRISGNNRIKSLTYNGKEVTDTQVFIIATDKITKPVGANSGVEKQTVVGGFNRGQAVLRDYIKYVLKGDTILPQVDYNWKVNVPQNYNFIIKTPFYAHNLFQMSRWHVSYINEIDKYRYYVATYPKDANDTIEPHIVLSPLKIAPTGNSYQVIVNAVDEAGLKSVKYLQGKYDVNYVGWPAANNLTANSFVVYKNGTYTVFAEDINGNKSVKTIQISNIRDDLLGTPTVESYTNRKASIKGTAEPNTTIIFDAYTGTYESKVSMAGTYSYNLPSQPSGTEVTIHTKDEAKGLESERVTVTVKRTGPNQPSLNPIYNNVGYITGDTNDDDATIVAIVDDKVYVSDKGGKDYYLNAPDLYNPALKIIETTINVADKRYYNISIPALAAGKVVTVYNIDHLYRISRANKTTVIEAAPNAPTVYEVSNIERSVAGFVPTTTKQIFDVTMVLNNKEYYTKTDSQGRFNFNFNEQLYAGDLIYVYVTDEVNGVSRTSYKTEVIIRDIQSYVKANTTNFSISRTTTRSSYIVGTYMDKGNVTLAITEGSGKTFRSTLYTVTTDANGEFLLPITEKLNAGAKIYAMIRFTDGKILLVRMTEVLAGRPNAPTLLREVNNTNTKVSVVAEKDCEVVLRVGTKTYTTKSYTYNATTKNYVYTFTITRVPSKTEIRVAARNSAGISDAFTTSVVKVAPENPKVNAVKSTAKTITGRVELLDYKLPVTTQTLTPTIAPTAPTSPTVAPTIAPDPKTSELFKNAPAKVASTQTRIFAKIGSKVYEGTIKNNGDFEIKIPAQKVGTKITIWGSNKAGRGPDVTVVVVK